MKKCLMAFAGMFMAGVLPMMAEFGFVSLDNCGNATTIVVADSVAGPAAVVSAAVLHNCGKTYKATAMRSQTDGRCATVMVKFKRLTEFSDTHLVLTVNGVEQTVCFPFDECCEPAPCVESAPSGSSRHGHGHGCGGHHGCR